MRILFLKSSSPISKLIMWATREDCSHMAFLFESGLKGLMFESNLLGTHPCFYQTEIKNHTVVHDITMMMGETLEDSVWDIIINQYDGKGYNYLGAIYLGWRKWLKTRFNIALPKQNKWSQPGAFFCDQVYDVLNKIPGMKQINVMNGMDTPHDVYLNLKDNQNG